mmetsp:Transcript_26000/g.39823  ORF Transcript_26000/g.39823 Transcript_26000/m.39823 type:complete len:297 (-) Transcript_26000:133-1023(-)|eukprot:CAMPEP_0118702584 /NCGR_PEP_ID=MMETSP0800-20121206/17978_1 /TAXON_ID=210618 ORGANISM="Striatella unipunctata, Strain CCMP2910" /NCGR_SAMPLE_ID=MMETSP0800 /ASSEMBLY_ACC=CAM_ASM_000638 /LENGTH=296 /DNA_ID=CAMNT_0006603813 /DNA_START=67 /DNA_END=957 /DNA_ORIENTATION=+
MFRVVSVFSFIALSTSVGAEENVVRVEDEIMSRDRILEHVQVATLRLEQRLNDPDRMQAEEDFDHVSFEDLFYSEIEEDEEDEEDRDLLHNTNGHGLLTRKKSGGIGILAKREKNRLTNRVHRKQTKKLLSNALKKEAGKAILKEKLTPGRKHSKNKFFHKNPPDLFVGGKFTRIPSPFELRVFMINLIFPAWLQYFIQPCRTLAEFLDIIDILPLGQLRGLCPESPVLRGDCDAMDAVIQAQLVCGVIIQSIEVIAERIPLINRNYQCTEACEIWYATFCSRCRGTSSRFRDGFR